MREMKDISRELEWMLEIPRQLSSNVLLVRPHQVERDTAGKLELEAWPDFRNFRNWRMNIRDEVSSCEVSD